MREFRIGLLELRRDYPDRLMLLSVIVKSDLRRELEAAGFLIYPDPSRAVEVAAALMRLGRRFAADEKFVPPPAFPMVTKSVIPDRAISEQESKQILADAGFPVIEERVVGSADEAKQAAKELGLPVANGETERTCYQLRPWFEKRALDIVQPDIGRCGITEGCKICEFAQVFHTPAMLHMGIAGPALIASSLQVAAGLRNVDYVEYQPVSLAAANRFVKQPIICEAGAYVLPDGPGLGIEIDEAALAPFVAGNTKDR